jgi:hypothetical protein
METTSTGILVSAFIGLFTVVVMIIAILIGWGQSAISTLTALEANKMAARALELAMHDHKAKFLPILIGYNNNPQINLVNSDNDAIFLRIVNTTYTTCTIQKVFSFYPLEVRDSNKFPFTLGYHNEEMISLKYPTAEHRQEVIAASQLHAAVTPSSTVPKAAAAITNTKIRQTEFDVYFTDSFNELYKIRLRFDTKAAKFLGTPEFAKDGIPILRKRKNKKT